MAAKEKKPARRAAMPWNQRKRAESWSRAASFIAFRAAGAKWLGDRALRREIIGIYVDEAVKKNEKSEYVTR